MNLRKGKTKLMLNKSIDCALLAVEIYNKPRTPFRVESYIIHMIMAWTKLLHAHFHHTIGDKFYYKKKDGRRYKIIDGERKSWELGTCIKHFHELSESEKANLNFFIKLRNKIEHHHINKEEIGLLIFGECQSLLFNYENYLIKLFGEEYALNESLAFSLQFSRIRTNKQILSAKTLLSKEVKELNKFISKYKESLSEQVYNSQEYSIKLIQIPKISNTKRNDLAVEFVNWNPLSEDDKKNFEKVTALIKDKVTFQEAVNPGKHKPGNVLKLVNEKVTLKISHFDHKCLYYIFSIRPTRNDGDINPFETNTKYCHYDEVHDDYVFQDKWVEFLTINISTGKLKKDIWHDNFKEKKKLSIENYEID
jgi:hypothetical protein